MIWLTIDRLMAANNKKSHSLAQAMFEFVQAWLKAYFSLDAQSGGHVQRRRLISPDHQYAFSFTHVLYLVFY